MIEFKDFNKINDFEWEIPISYRSDMNVPVRVFASEEIIRQSLKDKSILQAVNSASLPGLVSYVCVMPDVHQGYGFPIGGVAATDYETGVISPGGIGYDINCGVRLLSSNISLKEAESEIETLSNLLYQEIPTGVGRGGTVSITKNEFARICETGSRWALKHGYASEMDVEMTESGGLLEGADFDCVSERAIERGIKQAGSLGSGNHFLEVDFVEEIFNARSAEAMGLVEGNLALQIHCGSRGFGHQICSDFVKEFQTSIRKYNFSLPDRELVCAPIQSDEGQRYLAAMRCAANFAFCNRQLLTHRARAVFERVFEKVAPDFHLRMVYDLAHNIGKIETHMIHGDLVKVCVHRKGATRAFGPHHEEIPPRYRHIGQPVLIPGSMGTASWVLAGTKLGMEKTFGSCCHGAGRLMSRTQAKKSVRGGVLLGEMRDEGIIVKAGSVSGLAEEAPQAYKDVDLVIESAVGAGLASMVARLKPVVVIKG
ncbi:MAG: RtcB family protein [Chloroflexi bacterium]|nr:RtcB family protein [Chloroflexota bacterium]